jgi:hypothetical protein
VLWGAIAVAVLAFGRAGVSALPPGGPALGALAQQEIAAVRRSTARYHDIETAEADGYVNIGLYIPGEGHHWVNPDLVDGVFEAARPEILLYVPVPGEARLQLGAVEYLIPLQASPGVAPQGFTGSADVWREDSEEFGFWELTVWLWTHNPNGLFEHLNPRVP